MTWPLVWRRDYDEACRSIRQLEENVKVARGLLATQTHQYEQLLAMYHELKAAGALTPQQQTPPPVLQRRDRDDLFDAIELQAGVDQQLKRHLTRWAKVKQLEGVNPTDIINAVLHWQTEDDDTGSALLR